MTKHWQWQWRHNEPFSAIDRPYPGRDSEFARRDSAVADFFRSIGSCLDTLGVSVAIIGALDIDVVHRFTFPKLRNNGFDNPAHDIAGLHQAWLRQWLELALSCSGPEGWVEWSLDMRNMLVHRPRRTWLARVDVIRAPTGRPVGGRQILAVPDVAGDASEARRLLPARPCGFRALPPPW